MLEADRNPDPMSRAFVLGVLEKAAVFVGIDDQIGARALELEGRGFKAFDALHVASAENSHVDRFCTCDDRLLKKARQQTDLRVKVVSPLELAGEVSS